MSTITVKRLESGYWHIQGEGPGNWSQPPQWPCDEETLRTFAFPEASEQFIRAAMQIARATLFLLPGRQGAEAMTPTEHRHGTDRAAARDALLPADPGARLDLSLMSRQRGGLLSSEGRALGKSVLVAPPVCMGRRGAFCDPGGVWRTASATADSAAERWGSIPCQGSIHLPPADASSVGPGGLVAIGERAPSTPLCMGVEPGDGMRSGTFAFAIAGPVRRGAVDSDFSRAWPHQDTPIRDIRCRSQSGRPALRRVAQSAEPWVARSSRAPTSSRPTGSPRVGMRTAGGASVAHPAPGRRGEQSGDADLQLATVEATASGWGPPLSMRPPFSPEVST